MKTIPSLSKFYNEAFLVHSPFETPFFMNNEDALEFEGGKLIEVFITPTVISTDSDLKSLDFTERSCYIEGEKYLRFFQVYTEKNCEVECFSNTTNTECGCVPFYIARDKEAKVCSIFDSKCVENIKFSLLHSVDESKKKCGCLVACDSVSYAFELFDTRLSDP